MSDERLKRSVGESRQDTRLEQTLKREEGHELEDSVRAEALVDEWDYDALPNPPSIEGFHCCWLSTTNGADSITRRLRIGYVPVKAEELGTNWDRMRINSGEFAGCVSINEMILFKIPEAKYQAIMRRFHHELPAQEEERLRNNLQAAREGLGTGRQLVAEVGDGTASHGAPRPAPQRFT